MGLPKVWKAGVGKGENPNPAAAFDFVMAAEEISGSRNMNR
jgi:hypothetical protein